MAAEELPEALIAARAEARRLRERYDALGVSPLIWVARERYFTEAGTRRHRFVVKVSERKKAPVTNAGAPLVGVTTV